MDAIQILRDRGLETVPASFYNKIKEWNRWYNHSVESFYKYTIFNGEIPVKCTRCSLGMAKRVCEDWANLLLSEKCKITLEDAKAQAWIDQVFDRTNARLALSEAQETKSWAGTMAYVPYVVAAVQEEDGTVSAGSGTTIAIDFVEAPDIYPLAWKNRSISECAFASRKTIAGTDYLYLQIHRLDEAGEYVIENVLYMEKNGKIEEIPLDSVPAYAQVAPVVYTHSTHPQFVIDRLNLVNNTGDLLGNPMGIAVFANGIDQIKGIDTTYDSYVNEFILGRKRVLAHVDALKKADGKLTYDPNDLVFYALPSSGDYASTDKPVQELNMTLRAAEHSQGIQDFLNIFSAQCGLGESYYRFERGSVTTATQVVSENSNLFRTLKKHEIILRSVLTELCRILLRMGNAYYKLQLPENVEITVDFDDSIIEDKASERAQDRLDVGMGVMAAYEYRAKWYNESYDVAKKALPGTDDLLRDEPPDDDPDRE